MPRLSRRFPSLRARPLPAAPPVEIAKAPRPWLSLEAGQCAFPVDGEGWTTRACCNPCGADTYCSDHRAVTRGPASPSFDELERALRPYL
jgi:hypothetical protein